MQNIIAGINFKMEEDSSHEEMSVLISSDSGTVDINSIQDSALHGESLELNEERDVETVQSGRTHLFQNLQHNFLANDL